MAEPMSTEAVISAFGALNTVLLGAIAWFVVRFISKTEKSGHGNEKGIQELRTEIVILKEHMKELKKSTSPTNILLNRVNNRTILLKRDLTSAWKKIDELLKSRGAA